MNENVCEERIYNSLFRKEAEKIRNFFYYKSGNLESAEDLLQEAFIKLWINCTKVELSKAKSYLYTVANNLFIDMVRKDKVVLNYKKSKTVSNIENQSPDFLIEEQEFKVRLENAINELPENQRVVFFMSRIDKKKYREIAEELNLSVKAVEKRMHKALVHLRKIHKKV